MKATAEAAPKGSVWCAVALTLTLVSCGGGRQDQTSNDGPANPTGSAAPPASAASNTGSMNATVAREQAMKLWRDDTPSTHPKGACSGCHGADFFDLARIGSTAQDIVRRATNDGATAAEAGALAQSVVDTRLAYSLAPTDARTFRPFQPGGSVLLPHLTDGWNLAATNPTTENFWRMYVAVDSMLRLATPLGICKADDAQRCDIARSTLKVKFRSTLLGQHLMRMDALGRRKDFVDSNPALNAVHHDTWSNRSFLPSDFWLMGSVFGRVSLKVDGLGPNGKLGDVATALGLPPFVVDSIDSNRDPEEERQGNQRPWMWMGSTMEPSFARMEASFSTKVAEYMVATLDDGGLFNHAAFMTYMRLMAAAYLPEAATTADPGSATGVKRIANDRLHELTNYSYFLAYGRNVLGGGNLWGESLSTKGVPVPQELKDRSSKLWSTLVSNSMRATILLLTDELEKHPDQIDSKWRSSTLAQIKASGLDKWDGMRDITEHWARFQPQYAQADSDLVRNLAIRIGYSGSAPN